MMLREKTAIVTGVSRGIGFAIATEFLRNGATVFGISRHTSESVDRLLDLAAEHNSHFFFKQADVSNEKDVKQAFESILNDTNKLDILVNNAGITQDYLIVKMKKEQWDAVLQTNLNSLFLMCREATTLMIRQKSGSIINISSIVGIIGSSGQTNYAASKAGIIGFTKSLAVEVAKRNIRVNAIAPGYIKTNMTVHMTEEQCQTILNKIPLNQIGSPEDVAYSCVFLASDYASYITGHVLHVTGGMGS